MLCVGGPLFVSKAYKNPLHDLEVESGMILGIYDEEICSKTKQKVHCRVIIAVFAESLFQWGLMEGSGGIIAGTFGKGRTIAFGITVCPLYRKMFTILPLQGHIPKPLLLTLWT
jgi:hypothetical protein